MVKDLFDHCDALNNQGLKSMVAKIYGLYTVNVENMSSISLVIMPNLMKYVDNMN